MGGIMSYKRLRGRNGLARRIPPAADPYSEPDGESRMVNPRMLLGDWNRFERDVLGLSCWCERKACCEHPYSLHATRPIMRADGTATPYSRLAECTACDCPEWDSSAYHRDGEVCPSNGYARQLAEHAGTDEETVRKVVAAMMEAL